MSNDQASSLTHDNQDNQDNRHLDLLATFQFVLGGLFALLGCCPVIHLTIGIALLLGLFPQNPPPSSFESFGRHHMQQMDQPSQVPPGTQFQPDASSSQPKGPPPSHRNARERRMQMFAGTLFVAIALFIMAFTWAMAVMAILTGRNLKRRSSHTFCLVIGAIECIFMPVGTVLGVFTIVVLSRPSVKAMFNQGAVAAGSIDSER